VILREIVERLDLEVRSGRDRLDSTVTGAYVSDLLSDAIGHAQEGQVWITLQVHPNIVAVAVLKELSGIILVNNRQPEAETLEKAEKESIPLMVSRQPTFELTGKLYMLLQEC